MRCIDLDVSVNHDKCSKEMEETERLRRAAFPLGVGRSKGSWRVAGEMRRLRELADLLWGQRFELEARRILVLGVRFELEGWSGSGSPGRDVKWLRR
jgi:hypothetical protein